MPVFSAAVVAVAAAIATTTVATVATAAVAVSAAIGVAGLGVTAVGAITGNKDLLKAGKIMGYVGLAGGLAGGAIGGFGAMANGGSFLQGAADAFSGAASLTKDAASSYMDNISNFFNPGAGDQVAAGLTQESLGTGIVAGTNPSAAAGLNTAGLDQAAMGRGIAEGAKGVADAGLAPSIAGAANQTASTAQGLMDDVGSQIAPGMQPVSPPAAVQAPAPIAAPQAPGVVVNPDTGTFIPGIGQVAPGTAQTGAIKTGQGLFDSMPDWMKYSAMTTGAQGLSGLASGYYQGLSAEEQLNFQKLVNQQNQNQVQYLNKNNSYAPTVKFGTKPTAPTGLINRPGV